MSNIDKLIDACVARARKEHPTLTPTGSVAARLKPHVKAVLALAKARDKFPEESREAKVYTSLAYNQGRAIVGDHSYDTIDELNAAGPWPERYGDVTMLVLWHRLWFHDASERMAFADPWDRDTAIYRYCFAILRWWKLIEDHGGEAVDEAILATIEMAQDALEKRKAKRQPATARPN